MSIWTKILAFPGGHRYFTRKGDDAAMHVADDSGATPDLTDDGILTLDFASPLRVGRVHVPVISPEGVRSYIVASGDEAEFLLALWRVPAHSRNEIIRAWQAGARIAERRA